MKKSIACFSLLLLSVTSASAALISIDIQLETKPLGQSVGLTPHSYSTSRGVPDALTVGAGTASDLFVSVAYDLDPPLAKSVLTGFSHTVPNDNNSFSGLEYYAAFGALRIADTLHFLGDFSNGPVSGFINLYFQASMAPNAGYEAAFQAAKGAQFDTARLYAEISATSRVGGINSVSLSSIDYRSTGCGTLIADCANIVSDESNPAVSAVFSVDDLHRDVEISTWQFARASNGATFMFDPLVAVVFDPEVAGITFSADGGFFLSPVPVAPVAASAPGTAALVILALGCIAITRNARRRRRVL